MQKFVDQVRRDYEKLEPGQHDAWNPVRARTQLGYRLNLLFALARALQRSGVTIPDLKVLDLGCGTGRSARMYLDLGLTPAQVTGLDLRAGAIEVAKRANPAISFNVHDGGLLPGRQNWISTATLFSSVRGRDQRQAIADRITAALKPGEHLFYYDLRRANDFAGGDPIEPTGLFSAFEPAWSQRLGYLGCIPFADRRRIATPREMLADIVKPPNEAILFRRR